MDYLEVYHLISKVWRFSYYLSAIYFEFKPIMARE